MSRIRWNTEMVRNEMAKDNCMLIDEYTRGDVRIRYTYEDKEYTVRWNDWLNKKRPSRPHIKGGNRQTKPHEKWTNEAVNELLQKDDCELADEYKSTKQRFRYKYQNSYYWTTLDDWIHHKSRPHLYVLELEQNFREFLEEKGYEFQTQKSFDDLKSKKNYKLRFDFYLPQLNLLVEMDERGHRSQQERVESSILKDNYCREHHLKLLRVDETVTKEKFDEAIQAINEIDLYVFRYGRLYKQYDGKYKDIHSQM